jgi:hypothetical protein
VIGTATSSHRSLAGAGSSHGRPTPRALWFGSSGGETIGVYGLDGERQTVLTLAPGLIAPGDYDPVWSWDGASLLVPHGVEIPVDGSAHGSSRRRIHDPGTRRIRLMDRASPTPPAGRSSLPRQMGPTLGRWWSRVGSRTPYGRQAVIGSPSSIRRQPRTSGNSA